MLSPCLELTIAANQPLAKPYSTVMTVAVCLHKAGEPSSTTTTTAWRGARLCKYKPFFLSCWLYTLDNDAKKDWDPLKRILNCVTWAGNMCESCFIKIIDPMVTWRRNAQLMSNPKRHGYANCEWSCIGCRQQRTFLLPVSWLSKRLHRISSSSHSLRQGWESVSLVKVLFSSCLGYFSATVSLLPHLTVQICYDVVDIINSA